MVSADLLPSPAVRTAMGVEGDAAPDEAVRAFPDAVVARSAGMVGKWSYGHYLPRFPSSIDCGTLDPEILCAAVLGYN